MRLEIVHLIVLRKLDRHVYCCAFCSVSMALKPNLRIWTPKVGTALHWAAWYDRLDVVKLLVINRADVEGKDASGLRAADIVKKNQPAFC